MRIAVFHNLPSGGAKRALYEQVLRLSERHAIDVYTLGRANHAFCDIRPLVQRHRVFGFEPGPHFAHPFGILDHGVRTADLLRLRRVQRAIADEINQGGYDVALVHSDEYTNSPIVLQFVQIPVVYYSHDTLRQIYDPPITRPYSELTGLRSWVDRVNILRRTYFASVAREDKASLVSASRVLVNSYFTRECIYRLYAVSSRVCYLGIDVQAFRPLGLDKDEYVMSVGSVTPAKGFDFVIESLALIPEPKRPPLMIVGNVARSDEQSFLERLARRNGVRLEFRVLVKDSELVELYNRARITLCAPVLEPFGLVSLESMACGTPVIGVAEGGVRETIRHGETGLLTDRDSRLFADAILELLANPSLAEALSRQGVDHVREHWSWEDSVMRLQSHLAAVTNGKSY
jgi:glycosyltransferase involved in cell wall biosynthesis